MTVSMLCIGADFMGPEGLEPPQYFGPGAHPANEPPPIIRMIIEVTEFGEEKETFNFW